MQSVLCRIKRSSPFLLLSFLCFTGLSYHIYVISYDYFQYAVLTTINIDLQTFYQIQPLTVCFRTAEVFKYDEFNRMNQQNIRLNSTQLSDIYAPYEEIHEILSIADVLNYTPSVDEVLINCWIRTNDSFILKEYSSSQCREIFEIKRFSISTRICYWFRMVKLSHHQLHHPSRSYFTASNLGILFALDYNETLFKNIDFIHNIITTGPDFPWSDISTSIQSYRHYNSKTGAAVFNAFASKSLSITESKLRAPYETNCQDYQKNNYNDSSECLTRCVEQLTVERLGKISLIEQHDRPVNLKLLSDRDLENVTVRHAYRAIIGQCIKECPFTDCNYVATFTETRGEPWPSLESYVATPSGPSYLIKFHEKTGDLEVIIYICSALGIWIGFSFYGLIPNKIKNGRRKSSKGTDTCKCQAVNGVLITEQERNKIMIETLQIQVGYLMGRGRLNY